MPPASRRGAEAVDAIGPRGRSAVLAFNGQMALGVIAGLARQGIRVPEDLSVVGGDDVPMAAMTSPTLTTVTLPTDEAGAAALRMLDEEGSGHTELAAGFVVRGSSGPVSR